MPFALGLPSRFVVSAALAVVSPLAAACLPATCLPAVSFLARVGAGREQRREPLLRRGRLRGGTGRAGRAGERRELGLRDGVEARQRALERLRLVGDLELEERRLLHHRLCTFGVVDARQLDDDAVGARLLDDGLAHAELVDAVADDRDRAVERLGLVRDGALRLVDREREVHAALQVKSALQRHAAHGIGDEDAVSPHALDERAREQRVDGQRDQRRDRQEAVLQVRHAPAEGGERRRRRD